jgi:uncharacterized protein
MIVKLIILILVIWFGFRIYNAVQSKKLEKPKIKNAQAKIKNAQDMVSCDKCGIHIPVNEAIKSGAKYFCSQNHLPKKDE